MLAWVHLSPLKILVCESNFVSRALSYSLVVRLHPWGSLPSEALRNQALVCSAIFLLSLFAIILLYFRTKRGIPALHSFPMFYTR